ncbi:hypothetical protein ISN45_Aa08g014860 [Arabidopsis thaliana x Arabidopsis arenosa]|uniref:Uncharacterized protein n=1 Tax=Arabidopsis thaliana x Arabidopsis arenosa TaxID=1240361 RepID=A0A8T1XRP7_9BRAS|nr:hypothetical protein ISN45_Aa08g014860 [Arabidopsis thaliana x Arabidopsis arenosa]
MKKDEKNSSAGRTICTGDDSVRGSPSENLETQKLQDGEWASLSGGYMPYSSMCLHILNAILYHRWILNIVESFHLLFLRRMKKYGLQILLVKASLIPMLSTSFPFGIKTSSIDFKIKTIEETRLKTVIYVDAFVHMLTEIMDGDAMRRRNT